MLEKSYNNRSSKKVRDNVKVELSPKVQSQEEQFVLRMSLFCAVVLAIFGIAYGLYISSRAIVLDGFVSFLSVVLILLSVITSKYIFQEDDDVFQYGYARFEPMVNVFKSLILLLVCVYAVINGIHGILDGGYRVEFGGAMLFSFVSMILCIAIWLYTNRSGKRLGSPLIQVDSLEWLVDSVLYLGGFVAFGAIYFLDPDNSSEWALYVDSVLVVVLACILAVMPLKVFVANLGDLAMRAPPEMDDKVDALLENIANEYRFSDYDTHIAKSGRFYMIEVNILMDKNFSIQTIDQIDEIRTKIEQGLEIPSYKIWLSVSFTKNPKWL